jgi:hypothetical protein
MRRDFPRPDRAAAIPVLAGLGAACLAACHAGPNYRAPALPAGAEVPLVSLDAALETPAP